MSRRLVSVDWSIPLLDHNNVSSKSPYCLCQPAQGYEPLDFASIELSASIQPSVKFVLTSDWYAWLGRSMASKSLGSVGSGAKVDMLLAFQMRY